MLPIRRARRRARSRPAASTWSARRAPAGDGQVDIRAPARPVIALRPAPQRWTRTPASASTTAPRRGERGTRPGPAGRLPAASSISAPPVSGEVRAERDDRAAAPRHALGGARRAGEDVASGRSRPGAGESRRRSADAQRRPPAASHSAARPVHASRRPPLGRARCTSSSRQRTRRHCRRCRSVARRATRTRGPGRRDRRRGSRRWCTAVARADRLGDLPHLPRRNGCAGIRRPRCGTRRRRSRRADRRCEHEDVFKDHRSGGCRSGTPPYPRSTTPQPRPRECRRRAGVVRRLRPRRRPGRAASRAHGYAIDPVDSLGVKTSSTRAPPRRPWAVR